MNNPPSRPPRSGRNVLELSAGGMTKVQPRRDRRLELPFSDVKKRGQYQRYPVAHPVAQQQREHPRSHCRFPKRMQRRGPQPTTTKKAMMMERTKKPRRVPISTCSDPSELRRTAGGAMHAMARSLRTRPSRDAAGATMMFVSNALERSP